MKRDFKRYVSILVCAGMLAASFPIPARAVEPDAGPLPAAIEGHNVTESEIPQAEAPEAAPAIVETGALPEAAPAIVETGALPEAAPAIVETGALPGAAPAIVETGVTPGAAPAVVETAAAPSAVGNESATAGGVGNGAADEAAAPTPAGETGENSGEEEAPQAETPEKEPQPGGAEKDPGKGAAAKNTEDRQLVGASATAEHIDGKLSRVCEDAEVIISAAYSDKAGIPDEAEFVVEKIVGHESQMYMDSLEIASGQALSTEMVINDAVFYDISFLVDGEEIEPNDTVKMHFEYKQMPFSESDAQDADGITILHLTNDADSAQSEEQFVVEDVVAVDEALPIEAGNKLYDNIEEIQPEVNSDGGVAIDIEFNAEKFSVYAVALVSLATQASSGPSDYYKRVDSIDDVNANYLIVANDRGLALKASLAASPLSAPVLLAQVKGNPSYYAAKSDVTPDMLFKFDKTGSSLTSAIHSANGLYLNIPTSSVLNSKNASFSANNAQQLNLSFTSAGTKNRSSRQLNTWVIGYSDNDLLMHDGAFVTYNLRNYEGSGSYVSYFSQRSLLIYKQVNEQLSIPDDFVKEEVKDLEPDDPVDKPNYPAYIQPSAEQSGSYVSSGVKINYGADAATSQIESLFNGMADDGKVWADKSVLYGKDDYGAFAQYGDGAFSVALSAMSQKRLNEAESYDFPLDFVFVIDTSGSMNEVVDGQTRAQTLNNALNLAIHSIMKSHPQNRVGIVNFASNAKDDLPLGRYYVGAAGDAANYNGTAYPYYSTGVSGGVSTMRPNANLRDAGTKAVAAATPVTFTGATYTQLGIQQGAEMLLRNEDISVQIEGVSKNRTPVVILMSDGMPTVGTNHYMSPSKGPAYGQGNNSVGMAPGVLGYYTILTANYFKGMLSSHYKDGCMIYTIGIGISSRDSGDKYQMVAGDGGDEYARAVLNPSKEFMQDLLGRGSTNQYIHLFGKQLHALLNNQPLNGLVNPYSTTTYIEAGYNSYPDEFGLSSSFVPVVGNPYASYDYATGAYSDEEMTQAKLDEMISKTVRRAPVRQLSILDVLAPGTKVDFADAIGDGMEIDGPPVLRYNGANYAMEKASENTSNGVKTVVYKTRPTIVQDSEKGKVDLSNAQATITTAANGAQTVQWAFPDSLLPMFRKSLWFDYYLEMLPIRLIYQVKPTAAAMDLAVSGRGTMLYAGDPAKGASVSFSPSNVNPFYAVGSNIAITVAKTNNATGTSPNVFESKGSASAVSVSLGNNGRLYTDNYADKLPETGGFGTDPFTCVGAIALLVGLFIGLKEFLLNRKNNIGGNM